MITKITEEQLDEFGVASAPDRLTGTAAQNKAVFDRLVRQVVTTVVNQVVDELNAALEVQEETAHTHDNKELLDTYTQADANIEDAVNRKHSHNNKAVLDDFTAEQPAVLASILGVTQTLGNATDKVPSEKAVSEALTASGALPGGGTAGQALVKKSDAAYDMEWQNVPASGIAGVMSAEQGGTGKTTLKDAMNALINALTASTTNTFADDDYLVAQSVGGGTTDTTYYRKKFSGLWAYIKSKADAVYAALSHTHAAGDITSGTFDAARIPSLNTSKLTAGTLSVARGGTGQSTVAAALSALINGASALDATGLATNDYIGVRDTSATTGKKVTTADLATFILGSQRPTGTYIGTGTKSYSINIGGTGKFLLLKYDAKNWNDVEVLLVMDTVAFTFDPSASSDQLDYRSNITFKDGVLSCTGGSASSASYFFNGEGLSYTYQVL